MKSLLILILLVVCGGGAFLSKPSEQSFKDMILKQHADKETDLINFVVQSFNGKPDQFLGNCQYKDRIFWRTVECNGKTVYTGAFGTWFGRDFSMQRVTN